jgi:excisionase family DNA binding protein
MATGVLDAVVKPEPEERDALTELQESVDVLFSAGYTPCLIGPDGAHLELPHSVFEALRTVVRGMAAGHTMTLMPSGRMLTTQQAADMLQVSRPHLVKLLDEGAIPFELVGSHRRLRVEDVVEYRQARASSRRDALRELSQLSAEDPGGYR